MSKPIYQQPNVDIDIALAVLDVVRPAGMALTHEQIGSICGCSKTYIFKLEKQGIAKLRNHINNVHDYFADDVLEHRHLLKPSLQGVIA